MTITSQPSTASKYDLNQLHIKTSAFKSSFLLVFLTSCFGGLLVGASFQYFSEHPSSSTTSTRSIRSPNANSYERRPYIQSSKPSSPVKEDMLTASKSIKIVGQWLGVKAQIFAPPYNTKIADNIVANGPLWVDLTKKNGSIQWLRDNNSYYSYKKIHINNVISYEPSQTMPIIVLSITEISTLHSPNGNETSDNSNVWAYTLKREGGQWKIWDYKKQTT